MIYEKKLWQPTPQSQWLRAVGLPTNIHASDFKSLILVASRPDDAMNRTSGS
jgi:hypothetical protein